jgi:hypothetical protein
MATIEEKTERRWWVVKAILASLAIYVISLLVLFYFKLQVTELNTLTMSIFSFAGGIGIANWFSSPSHDESSDTTNFKTFDE